MKKLLALIVCLAVLALASVSAEMPMIYMPGDIIDDFTVELCDGSVFTLSEALATHDAVMINIWATWCGPCRQEFPYMEEAYNLYSDKVALVCLSAFDTNEDIAQFMADQGLTTLPMGEDTVGLSDALVQEGYPTTIIVDRFGVYAYYECGSMLAVDSFTSIWDIYVGEDYTETVLFNGKYSPADFDIEIPSDEELSAVLCPEGTVSFYSDTNDVYAWPFLPAEDCVVSSMCVDNTYAEMYADVTVNEGDVLAFDYTADFDYDYGVVIVYVDDAPVFGIPGAAEGSFAYRFTEAGEHTLQFEHQLYYLSDSGASDIVTFANVQLLNGEAADAALANIPAFPVSLEGNDIELTFLNENAKQIVIEDPSGTFDTYYGGVSLYIVPDDTALVHVSIGPDVVPYICATFGDFDYEGGYLTDLETDETGFIFETGIGSIADGDYSNTYITADDTLGYAWVIVWKDEMNVNYFLAEEFTAEVGEPIEGISWHYADGTLPSTSLIATASGKYTYTISLVDAEGNPIANAMVNVCTDETCVPSFTNAQGIVSFESEPYPYSIHVLKAPAGYAIDTSAEYIMDSNELTIVIPKA